MTLHLRIDLVSLDTVLFVLCIRQMWLGLLLHLSDSSSLSPPLSLSFSVSLSVCISLSFLISPSPCLSPYLSLSHALTLSLHLSLSLSFSLSLSLHSSPYLTLSFYLFLLLFLTLKPSAEWQEDKRPVCSVVKAFYHHTQTSQRVTKYDIHLFFKTRRTRQRLRFSIYLSVFSQPLSTCTANTFYFYW